MSEELIEGLPPLICALIGGLILYGAGQWLNNSWIKDMEELERQWELKHKS